jgi:type IV pilus assembly protein PilV
MSSTARFRNLSPTARRMRAPISAASQRGVGMVEVLVAVLVLAIGLLGVAAMQATALRNSQSSLQRSQGVVYIYTILDSMRANPNAVALGAYNMALTCTVPGGGNLVAEDQRSWMQAVQQNLGPTACGQIQCAAGMCDITVRWDDSRGTGGSTAQTFTTRARL